MDAEVINASPATGFYGGKYDEIILERPILLFRVASAREAKRGVPGLGRWFTEAPLLSAMQLQIDAAAGQSVRAPAEVSLAVRVPAGTTIYRGPVASQGNAHVGGMDKIYVYIPDLRSRPGVEILSAAPAFEDW